MEVSLIKVRCHWCWRVRIASVTAIVIMSLVAQSTNAIVNSVIMNQMKQLGIALAFAIRHSKATASAAKIPTISAMSLLEQPKKQFLKLI